MSEKCLSEIINIASSIEERMFIIDTVKLINSLRKDDLTEKKLTMICKESNNIEDLFVRLLGQI